MENQLKFICNDKSVDTSIHPGLSLLDFLRNEQKLTGTKEGCREGDCGACTVLVGELIENEVIYKSVNSCIYPVGDALGKHIVTVEGINLKELTIIQEAFLDEGASQCGFCTPGFIVSLTGNFLSNQKPNYKDAIESLDGNICRCTGYVSIQDSVKTVVDYFNKDDQNQKDHIQKLVKLKIIPEYFLSTKDKLKKLHRELESASKSYGSDKHILSGGTDLLVQKWEDILKYDVRLIFDSQRESKIILDGKVIKVKATTTVSEFFDSEIIRNYFSDFKNYLKLFGSLPIRNRATLGGNIINASPIADMTNILLALDATLIIKNGKDQEIKLKEFYTGYKKMKIINGEILAEIQFHSPAENSFFNYEKVSRRTYLDIASVNTSMYLEIENNKISIAHLSAGGVAPIPLYLLKTSQMLAGAEITSENLFKSIEIAITEISPISDARGTKEYKSLLLRNLIICHFQKFFPHLINAEELV